MATLEQEVQELKTRVTYLEALIHRVVPDTVIADTPTAPASQETTHLVAWLKRHGLVREPTAEERRVAAAWEALSAAEQEAHILAMRRLHLEPPLSQLLLEQRH